MLNPPLPESALSDTAVGVVELAAMVVEVVEPEIMVVGWAMLELDVTVVADFSMLKKCVVKGAPKSV